MDSSVIFDQLSGFFVQFIQLRLASIIASTIGMLVIVVFALWGGWFIRFILQKRFGVRQSVTRWIVRTFRVTLILVGALAILDIVGVDITSFVAALGIVGFAIAIGLRSTINNVFTGLMRLSLRPYVAGGHISSSSLSGLTVRRLQWTPVRAWSRCFFSDHRFKDRCQAVPKPLPVGTVAR